MPRPKSMPAILNTKITDQAREIQNVTEKIDIGLNSADRSSKKQEENLKVLKNEFEKNIKSALDMMKKLKNKDLDNEWKNRILFPPKSADAVRMKAAFYKKQIEQNSHAAALDKVRQIFSANKRETEKTRLKQLENYIISYGSLLEAHKHFFEGCSDLDRILGPLSQEFDVFIKKLGPTGKQYIRAKKELEKEELWKENYNFLLLNLHESFDYVHVDKDTTSYTVRVIKTYAEYREKAIEFKEKMCKAFTATFNKFKSGANNSYLAGTGGKLFEAYNNMRKNLKTSNEQFEEFTETISNNPKIFGDPSVCKEMGELLVNIKECIDTMSSLSKIFANNITLYVMKVDNDTLNKKTTSLLNNATDLFSDLGELKKLLLAGNHVNAKKKLSSFNKTYECANDELKSYEDTLNSIDTLEPLRLESVLSVIERANSNITPYNKEFAKQLNKAKDAVGKFKSGKVTIVLSIIKTMTATFSGLLGPYTTILNTVLSCFGSLVITPLVNLAYDT